MAQPLPAVHAQVADVVAEQADELVAQVEVEGDAIALAPQRRLRGDAAAELQAEFAQAVVQGADVAQADAHALCGAAVLDHGRAV